MDDDAALEAGRVAEEDGEVGQQVGRGELRVVVQIPAVSIFHQNFYEMKIQQGMVQEQNLDGGRTYLHELHFQPVHSPLWGQAHLMWQRGRWLLQGRETTSVRSMPATPYELGRYFIALDSLDFWWLHLRQQQLNILSQAN